MTAQLKKDTWTDVCQLDDLVPESGVAVRLGKTQIALFYWPKTGEVFALGNTDPFSSANVIARGIVGDVQGKRMVASPLYKQHFCLETGQCLEDDAVSLMTWPARLEEGQVLIQQP